MRKGIAPSNTVTPEQQSSLARVARLSLRMLGLVTASYVLDTAILTAFWLAGATRAAVPLAYLLAGTVTTSIFQFLFRSGLHARWRDASLTAPQMLVAILVQIAFLAWAPEMGFLFLSLLFLVYGFGILALDAGPFLRLWLVGAAGLAAALHRAEGVLYVPSETATQRLLLWVALVATLGRFVYLSTYVSRLRQKLKARSDDLSRSLRASEALAQRDGLTGVLNRRSLDLALERALAARSAHPFGIALFDLDHFKRINDGYGHAVGDEVLRRLAGAVAGWTREEDVFGRFGGEEFLLLLPDNDTATARAMVERLRTAVETLRWDDLAPGLAVTVSIGLADALPGDTRPALIQRADDALYAAKAAGRNRVVAFEPRGAHAMPPLMRTGADTPG